MTEKDILLIKKAFEYFDGSDWIHVSSLEEQADSEEARLILHDRKIHLYRKEEAFAGLN